MHTGQIIADDFVLQQLLFQDATGELWRALESQAGRLVILRFIPQELINDLSFLFELKRHADLQKSFACPHAVMIHRVLDLPGLGPVFVMPHVDGPFLDQYASQWITVQGKFPYNLLFDVFQPVANALDIAREKGILHQSLSPKKIIVSPNEGVHVFDFELSGMIRRRLHAKGINWSHVEADMIRYLPPEELINDQPEAIDSSCDQYALAMIIEELLLKKVFIDSRTGDLKKQIFEKQAPRISNCPVHVNAALQRALQKNPEDRLLSCVQFMDALGGLIPVTVPKPTPFRQPKVRSKPTKTKMSNPIGSSNTPPNPSSVAPSVSNRDSVVSFDRISSDANKASAQRIEGKIKQERRWRQLFMLWNVLILIACLVVFVCFRNHLSSVWRQRVQGTVETDNSGNSEGKPKRRTYGSVKQDQSRSNRKRQEKEVDFNESNESSFSEIQGLAPVDNLPDEIRFIGISKNGKKIAFVIDASSSMGDGKMTPWSYVCGELVHSFRDLNESQFFQVVYYDEQSHRMQLDEQSDSWISANEQTKKQVYQFLKQHKPSGRSNPILALEDALSMNPDVVFLLSEQKSVKLSSAEINKIKQAAGRHAVNVVEIGGGPESDPSSSLRQLAQATRGEYRWINGDLHGLAR